MEMQSMFPGGPRLPLRLIEAFTKINNATASLRAEQDILEAQYLLARKANDGVTAKEMMDRMHAVLEARMANAYATSVAVEEYREHLVRQKQQSNIPGVQHGE